MDQLMMTALVDDRRATMLRAGERAPKAGRRRTTLLGRRTAKR